MNCFSLLLLVLLLAFCQNSFSLYWLNKVVVHLALIFGRLPAGEPLLKQPTARQGGWNIPNLSQPNPVPLV